MRSVWLHVLLLFIYFCLLFFVCRLLDLVLWYPHGISSTQIVDPLVLSVRQLKHLLEYRGVSYTGYVEKKELAQLVKESAEVVQGEVDELTQSHTVLESDSCVRECLPKPPPPSHFTGGLHFYEEVEDTKDSVWLVQVVPANGGQSEPLLDDYSWRVVCNQVAPFAIRTGIFDCKLDRRLCSSKGWRHPLLLLALPKGTRAKDKVILRTFTSTRPQPVVEWVRDQLSIRVKTIENVTDLKHDWLGEEPSDRNTTSTTTTTSTSSAARQVKVLLLTHLLHPPLFLAALSIKFSGRIKFGMFSVKKQNCDILCKKLKFLDYQIPSYLIITPERKVIYGQRRFEHFNFASMNLFLRAIQPEMNDVFLCSLVLVNMLVSLQIFQVTMQLWWKYIARCLWTLVSYNFWLFSIWLTILATYRFSVVNFLAEKCLMMVRLISLTNIGSLLRSDWQILSHHPYLLFLTFFLYITMVTWILKLLYPINVELERDSNQPWWEVLPVDSYWINCFFRPMASLSRPIPPSELELEEGIEMLIERLAVPNLWLQPVIPNDYIKDLPVWKFRGWDHAMLNAEASWPLKKVNDDSPEAIQELMDRKELHENSCKACSVDCTTERVKNRCLKSSPCTNRKKGDCEIDYNLPHFNCCRCLADLTYSADRKCCRCGCFSTGNSSRKCYHSAVISNHSTDDDLTVKSCPCVVNREFHSERVPSVSLPCNWETWTRCDSRNVKDSSSISEDSGDESGPPPSGMLPTLECAVCLETYTSGTFLCGLPCGHSYHQGCIMLWLQRDNHHCPVCRWPAYRMKLSPAHQHKE